MADTEGHARHADYTDDHGHAGESSVSSSFAHLLAGSQGVVTKRIDLALLEAQELFSRNLRHAALIAFAVLLGAGAWFAAAACLVQLANPRATPLLRLTAFGLLNAGGALGLAAFAMRGRPHEPAHERANESSAAEDHVEGRSRC